MKKVLVTGGLGFIGSHLVERLVLKEGVHVIVIDNLATGRRSNLSMFQNHPNLTIIIEDLSNLEAIEPHFKGVDTVYHLGALAAIVPSIEKPTDYYHSNVTGTLNLLEASRKHGIRRLLYTASSSCYGIADKFPTPETEPIRPQYPYALTKYLGEQTALHWGQVYKMNVVSLRLFNVFGPRHRTTGAYGAVIGVFLAQKSAGKPLTVVGDGTQTRDFTYVTDVVDAFITAANSDLRDQVFNVGSGGTYSVNQLAGLVGGPTVAIPKRPGEPDCTFADIRKIGKSLGWRPKVKFDEGVRKMMEHLDEWADAPVWTPEKIAAATEKWFRYLSQ